MKTRRRDFTEEEIKEMHRLEEEGKSRKEISLIMQASPSAITRRMGAVRCYGSRRLKVA